MKRAGPTSCSGGGAEEPPSERGGGEARPAAGAETAPDPASATGEDDWALAGVGCMWTIAAGGAVGDTGRGDVPVATAPPTIVKAIAPAASLAARGVARSACWPTRVTMRARQRWAQRARAGAAPNPRPTPA